MTGVSRNKFELLPYSTTISTPSSALSYAHHRPSKREYIESSDVEDVSSSPPRPRKYRATRKRREWRDSSDIGYSSDLEGDGVGRAFEDAVHMLRERPVGTVGVEKREAITSTQCSQDNSISKFHRLLNTAIMDGLDSVDFSYMYCFM